MDVGSEADVVGEVPANVVRVVVDYDLVSAPIPTIAVTVVIGRYVEEESAEPKSVGSTTTKTPDVITADSTIEVSVRPWVVKMVMRVAGATVVSYPAVIGVDVGCVGMAGLVAEASVVFRAATILCWRSGMTTRLGAVRGDVTASLFVAFRRSAFVASLLGESCYRADQ